jgi:hypothetical protein
MATVLPAVLDDLTNQERQSQNLPVLTVNPLLTQAAQMKANDMATNSYFAHTSPRGLTPWYWLEQVGYNYQYAGENLAINFTDSQDVTNAWMASPTHKANIVKENYTEVGTGVATGMYQGQEAVFVVQDYANPLPITTPTVSINTVVKTAPANNITTTKEPVNVLGAETVVTQNNITQTIQNTPVAPVKQPTPWQMLIASPRHATNIILYVVFAVILFALFLYILLKRKNHHIDLITNGLIVIAVVGAIFIGNYYLTHRNMLITQSLDYAKQSK